MQRFTVMPAVALALVWVAPAAAKPPLKVLQYLTEQTGGGPEYPPIIGQNGTLYGTAYSEFGGALYSINMDGTNFTVLFAFSGGAPGSGAFGGLIQGTDGMLYGTTLAGGTSSLGTVYQFDPATRTETVLHAFDLADGATPYAGVVQDGAGNLYGTTSAGGANNVGTIYKLAAGTHEFTKLADLDNRVGAVPYAPLVVGPDGALYGTASLGGPSGEGTIFRVSPTTGKIELLHAFSGPDGAYCYTGLTQGKAGMTYGVTGMGGAKNHGVVFAFDLNGRKLKVLHQFANADGAYPQGAIALDSAGNLLGTTFAGGIYDGGVIYRYNPVSSSFRVLKQFVPAITSTANAGLTYAGGQTFFGGTLSGGQGQYNTGAIISFTEP